MCLLARSGTATWYFHYDAELGKRRERRKLKIGRLDEVTLARALGEAERLRPLIRQGADPVSQKAANREAITFADLAAERFDRGDPLRPGMQRDYRNVLGKDVLPAIGNIPAKAVTREMSEAAKAHTGVEFTPDVKAHMVESILTKMEDQNIYAFVDP